MLGLPHSCDRWINQIRENIFQHRNKTLSIIILVSTLLQISKKDEPLPSQSLNLPSLSSNNLNISIEDRWLSDLNLSIYKPKQDGFHKAILSHTGLVLGIDYFGIIYAPHSEISLTSIDVTYIKSYRIYGYPVYSVMKPKTIELE